jgi:hypothetical protein
MGAQGEGSGSCAGHTAGRRRKSRGEARPGYVGSRDALQRVSARFYMHAGARAQGEGGVQKKQIGTGARLMDFYRAKHPGSMWHARQGDGGAVQHPDSIDSGWWGCGVEDLLSRGAMRGRGFSEQRERYEAEGCGMQVGVRPRGLVMGRNRFG